jgi:hypothetical protein
MAEMSILRGVLHSGVFSLEVACTCPKLELSTRSKLDATIFTCHEHASNLSPTFIVKIQEVRT